MPNAECKHKNWRLVKTNNIQDFKIWECEECQFRLKEKTSGLHEVFVVKDLTQVLVKNRQNLGLKLTS